MSDVEFKIINCFATDENYTGNPAVIVNNFLGNDNQKQILAKNFKLPVTVFIEAIDEGVKFRFFYPNKETNLCMHGALAAASTVIDKQINIYTNSNEKLHIFQTNDDFFHFVSSKKKLEYIPKVDNNLVKFLLNIKDDSVISSVLGIASVGSPKLIVEISNLFKLSMIYPNIEALKVWSVKEKVNGIYLYAKNDLPGDVNYYTRSFNPNSGILEDAATGVAVAALSAELQQNMIVEQGRSIGRPSRMMVQYKNDEQIIVGGKVKLICGA